MPLWQPAHVLHAGVFKHYGVQIHHQQMGEYISLAHKAKKN